MYKPEVVKILLDRVDHLISIMETAAKHPDNFNMEHWFYNKYGNDFMDYDEIEVGHDHVDCGTAACFAGWCAVDPVVNPPVTDEENEDSYVNEPPTELVTKYLFRDILFWSPNHPEYMNMKKSTDRIRNMIGEMSLYDGFLLEPEKIYGKSIEMVKPADVIVKLEELKSFIKGCEIGKQ